LPFVPNYTNIKTFPEQINEFDHFVGIVALVFMEVEHAKKQDLMWHMHHHY